MRPEYRQIDQLQYKAIYLTKDSERNRHEIHFSNGKLHWSDGTILSVLEASFVMDGRDEFNVEHLYDPIAYAIPKRVFHSTFLAGQPFAVAGTLDAEFGVIQKLHQSKRPLCRSSGPSSVS